MAASQPLTRKAAQKERNIQRIRELKIMLAAKRDQRAEVQDDDVQVKPSRPAL
jgi:hypothetical protein